MSKPTYFLQECPTCGRRLEIRVEYLGRNVTCQHCRGWFVASDSQSAADSTSQTMSLLHRADKLLELADRRKDMLR